MTLKPIALAAGLAAMSGLSAPAAAQVNLSFGYGHAETALWTTVFTRPWLDAASARIEGGLQYEVFTGGSVVTFASALEALSSGVVDSTMLSTQFFRSQLPANVLLVDIGGTFGNRLAAIAAMSEMIMHNCPECVAEDEQWSIVPIIVDSSGPYQLLCNRPINAASDMAGLRIRATGLAGRVIEEMGATPANVAFAEIFESLQRGVINCAAGDPAWLTAYSYRDVVTHVVEVNVTKNVIPHLISFNREFWDDLTPEAQAILIEEGQRAFVTRLWAEEGEFNDARADLERTISFTAPPDWMLEAVARANARIHTEAVQIAQNAGVANAQEIADRFLAIYARWEAELAGREVTAQEFTDILLGITANYHP